MCVGIQSPFITGSTYGLSLVINVEEYDYMLGPYSDSGIKV